MRYLTLEIMVVPVKTRQIAARLEPKCLLFPSIFEAYLKHI
jgi:hypothetical protein